MSAKIVSQQNYYHLLRENMEPKNMKGFCELTQKEAMDVDGGYRFISGDPQPYRNNHVAAAATCSIVASCFGGPAGAAIGIGLTLWGLM